MDPGATPQTVRSLVRAGCLKGDPVPWLLGSNEPYALWATLHDVVGLALDEPALLRAHDLVIADENVRALVDDLPPRLTAAVADHHSPLFLPNRLNLLADMGVAHGDFPVVDALLESLAATQDRAGRFRPRATGTTPQAHAGASPRCEHNAVTEVLLRFGLAHDPRVTRAVARLSSDIRAGNQGHGWCCTPEKRSLSVLAHKLDVCPQIDLEGVRALAMLPAHQRPRNARDAARTPLEIWRRRPEERPYQFGHGYQFKTVRWPSFWYDVLGVVDAVGRFPDLWSGPHAREEDRRAVAELAACLIAYNTDSEGRVKPRRVHRGYERFSFADKSAASPFATARVLAALVRVADLADEIAAIDVESLASSTGGSGTVLPPEKTAPDATVCTVPAIPVFDPGRVLARVLTRHHLGDSWEQQSADSVIYDVIGLTATDPLTPYRSLASRLPGFDAQALESALDERHSLVRWRGMRGLLMVVRRDFVPVIHGATSRQVIRYARDFAQSRGVTSTLYERLAPAVLAACAEAPLSRQELRDRLDPRADLGAVLTLMNAEALLVRVRGERGRSDRRMLYAPTQQVLPGIELGRYSLDDARMQLLRAYVRGYGPVTRHDAAWWTGMDLKRVDRAVRMLEDELLEIALKGREGTWLMHAADVDELERAALMKQPNVAALPANDPLMLGYADRARFLDDVARPFVFDAANNSAPVVCVDGRVVAVWDVAPAQTTAEGPQVLIFPVAPIGAEVAELIGDRAARVLEATGQTACGARTVSGMRSLLDRPVGAFAHPLR